jgi:hypothetical protein
MWHSLPDDLANDLSFHMRCHADMGTACQTTLQTTFIQGNDVETKQQDLSFVRSVSGMMAAN